MASYSKMDIAALKKKKAWFTVKAMEQFRFWNREKPWDFKYFQKHRLNLVSASVSTTEPIGVSSTIHYKKKNMLRLPSGFCIDKGSSGVTSQSRFARFQNIRVDDVIEFNSIMKELSLMFNIDMWEIKGLQIHNTKLGPVLDFKVFDPDGSGAELYLDSVSTIDSKRTYFEISAFEQQELCNHIQEKIAHCVLVARYGPECGIKEYHKEKADANP